FGEPTSLTGLDALFYQRQRKFPRLPAAVLQAGVPIQAAMVGLAALPSDVVGVGRRIGWTAESAQNFLAWWVPTEMGEVKVIDVNLGSPANWARYRYVDSDGDPTVRESGQLPKIYGASLVDRHQALHDDTVDSEAEFPGATVYDLLNDPAVLTGILVCSTILWAVCAAVMYNHFRKKQGYSAVPRADDSSPPLRENFDDQLRRSPKRTQGTRPLVVGDNLHTGKSRTARTATRKSTPKVGERSPKGSPRRKSKSMPKPDFTSMNALPSGNQVKAVRGSDAKPTPTLVRTSRLKDVTPQECGDFVVEENNAPRRMAYSYRPSHKTYCHGHRNKESALVGC
ncbi:hypothetical protein BIW11_09310, partial [Tropilaelaps mercedesae]